MNFNNNENENFKIYAMIMFSWIFSVVLTNCTTYLYTSNIAFIACKAVIKNIENIHEEEMKKIILKETK